jgi:hypothetical protein
MIEIIELIPSTGNTPSTNDVVIYHSNHAIQHRRAWVADQYYSFVPPSQIFKVYKELFHLSKPSFDKDVQAIREANNEASVLENRDAIMNEHLVLLKSIIATAMEDKDTHTALQAGKQVLDLMKLGQPHGNLKGTNIQINNNSFSTMSPAELLKYLGR